MPKLYLIARNRQVLRNPWPLQLLEKAAESQKIDCDVVEAAKFSFYTEHPRSLEVGSMLYRLSTDRNSALVEALLIGQSAATFYKDQGAMYARRFGWSSDIVIAKAGLPVIPSVYFTYPPSQQELDSFVLKLGGFPIVIKRIGGSHGSSTRLANNHIELNTVLEELIERSAAEVVLKKYLRDARHIRCIVIGEQAVDFIEYFKPKNDFRTNAVDEPTVQPFKYSEELAQIATKAINVSGLEFGAVDILIEGSTVHIAEINFPCNFARNQLTTGTDIAGMMLAHLKSKTQALID